MTRSHTMILLFLGLGTAGAGGAYLLSDAGPLASPEVALDTTPSGSDQPAENPLLIAEPAETEGSDIDPDAPRFDSVRIEPDGNGVVAGRAVPGADIAVVVEGETIAETQADASGSFAAFVTIRPASRPRIMSLVSDADGVEVISQTDVMLPPDQVRTAEIETPVVEEFDEDVDDAPLSDAADSAEVEVTEPQSAEAETTQAGNTLASDQGVAETPLSEAPDGATDADPQTAIVVADAAPGADLTIPALSIAPAVSASVDPINPTPETPSGDTNPAPADTAIASSELLDVPDVNAAISPLESPDATLPEADVQLPILLASEDGVRVLQPAVPQGAEAEVLSTVALDTISYDASGEVLISGRMRGQGSVRVYLNNALITETASQGGDWQMKLEDVNTGVYTMRIDQVDSAGSVVSRIETPFRREERATLAAVLAEDLQGADIAVRTVQPGNTLWGISRDRYGEGTLYVQVFDANRDLIRDPDLIYPGQILRLPQGDAPAE